jgi:polysaccharide export outer membrane protein
MFSSGNVRLCGFLAGAFLTGHALIGRPNPPAQGAQAPTLQERYPRYRLRAGDVLDLNFPFTPEFNQTVTVQPDGYITLRALGEMRVQDKTTAEVVEALRTAYTKILRDPTVTIELKEFEKPYFIVGGEVTHPGKYDLRGDTTVVQAVTIAGGVSDRSKSSQIFLFRRVSDDWVEVKAVNMKKMLGRQDLSEDLHLRAGDMVLVPKSTMAKLNRFIPTASMGLYLNPFNY